MSKLGKKPIIIPKDTKVKLESGRLILTGPKGSKELTLNDKIFTATIADDKSLILKLIKKNEELNMIWGTTRSIVNSAIIGVSVGFEKTLELTGVGFRAMLKGNVLNLQLGFSHDTTYELPQGVKLTVEKQTIIKISGIDNIVLTKLDVLDELNTKIGKVINIMPNVNNDNYIIKTSDNKEIIIPSKSEWVKKIDICNNVINIVLPKYI